MANRTITVTDQLYDYLRSVSKSESEVLTRLREETSKLPMAMMQISPEQGQFMALLVKAIGVKKALEIGVFTGYSGCVVAMALPADGKLIACDVSEEWTAIARRYWQEAGVAHKIELNLRPAVETLDSLLNSGQAGTFDYCFIDADKPNYMEYYERALKLLRTGGLIAIDNVLWGGRVADPNEQDESTVALRELNAFLAKDGRIALSMVPIGDGVTLALKL